MKIKYEFIFLTCIDGESISNGKCKCWYDIKIKLISEHTFHTIQIMQSQAM